MEPLQCIIRPLLENLPAVQAPFLQFRFPKHPNRKHLFSCRFALRSRTKCQRSHSGKKHDSTPRPSTILLIFTDSGMSRCFATQDEYLSHVDVSRGHSKTIYNQSWNLAGNFKFSPTLIETMILQSRAKHWANSIEKHCIETYSLYDYLMRLTNFATSGRYEIELCHHDIEKYDIEK